MGARRQLIVNFLLFMIVLFLLIGLIEFYTRVLISRMDENSTSVDLHLLEDYGPAESGSRLRYTARLKGNGTHVQEITEEPLRGWFSQKSDNGVLRIVGVGDSHIGGGGGVFSMDCYLSHGPLPERECPIFSIGGFNIEDKSILIEERILPLDPDVIVLQLLEDDCQFKEVVWDWFPQNSGTAWHYKLMNGMSRIVYKWSYMYRYALLSLQARNGDTGPPLQDISRCSAALNDLVHMIREKGILLVPVMSHNVLDEFSLYPQTSIQKEFSSWFKEEDVRLNLSTVYALDSLKNMSFLDVKGDENGHMNHAGGAIVQEAVYHELVKRHII